MAEYKEFRWPDEDQEGWPSPTWDEVYGVLVTDVIDGSTSGKPDTHREYILNAAEPGHSFLIRAAEIDRYIEILNWIKQQEAVNHD